MQKTPYQVIEMAQKLKDGQISRRFKVRAVLKWFGAKRRGDAILAEIQGTLSKYGLVTVPPFEKPEIDDDVKFELAIPLTEVGVASGTKGAVLVESVPPVPLAAENVKGPLSTNSISTETPAPNEDQLEPDNGDEVQVIKPDDHPVTSRICDWPITALTGMLDRGQLDLQPQFQRQYVWALRPELPSRLIESLLLKIPIPPIYFGNVPGGRLEVIDGQQRLTTLVKFVRNEFALCKLQRMSSLNGKYFKDLTVEQQEKILREPIRSIEIDAAGNTELRYEVFERLNRGSMALNEQELRNCVYRGQFNQLLAELEKDLTWRKMKGGPIEPRFKEREVILRFFAFANRLPQYTGNLKSFLNEYMRQYAPREEAALKAHAALFRQTMQNIYAVFGTHSARLYEINQRTNNGDWDSKFSVTALDIQAAALMNRPAAKVQLAAEQIRELFLFTMLTDAEMQDAISRRTGSTVQTKIRFTKFKTLVDALVDGVLAEPRFFDLQFRKELWNKAHVCQLCKNEIHSFEDCTVDHIMPYSKKGKTVPANAQLAHRGCNARKNAQVPKAIIAP